MGAGAYPDLNGWATRRILSRMRFLLRRDCLQFLTIPCKMAGKVKNMAISRPMHDMALRNRDRLRLHVPGHKGQALFETEPVQMRDVTELPVTDDLYAPFGPIAMAQELAARAAGAANTLMLTGGSTAGIHTMLLYSLAPGETVILPRNAHLSFINGCVLADLNPVYVPLQMTLDGYAYAPEEGFLEAIRLHPEARAVVVTRPDYYGGMAKLSRIAAFAHESGMRLLVDEAHGAHLPWMTDFKSAASYGADLWVQSAHKTLPALTAGAFLHLSKGEDLKRALQMLRMVQTSSPAFYVMQSLDDARAFMEEHGSAALKEIQDRLKDLRAGMKALGYADAHEAWRGLPLEFDPTRLVITAPQGGYALANSLKEQGVDVEMADDSRIVCILTVMDKEETFQRLFTALNNASSLPQRKAPIVDCIHSLPRQVMRPRQASLGRQELVDALKASGRISGTSAGLYPPGIPLVAPGEEISPEIVEILLAAPEEKRFGLFSGKFLCAAE
jgi:arginine/lysine/ornithine decarboxylase